MKNVCNIFDELKKETGNFILFSTYTDDLSRSVAETNYKVRPSRFLCLNLENPGSGAEASALIKYVEATDNEIVPQFLQNVYENGLSLMRENNNYDDWKSALSFLGALSILSDDGSTDFNLDKSLVYDGSIELTSSENGFSDIILNILSGSKKKTYTLNPEVMSDIPTTDSFIDAIGSAPYSTDGYICGWTSADTVPLDDEVDNPSIVCDGHVLYDGLTNDGVFDYVFNSADDNVSNSFTFNTIVILYDVLDGDNEPIYRDMPMGIYFTGLINDEGEIQNPVTIYTSVSESYGAGSGWSLRICTRFTPTPSGYIKVDEVALESLSGDITVSALMSANAEAIKALNSFVSRESLGYQTLKDLCATLKDGRMNVPYIRFVDGVAYWFVNGKNTEMPVYPEPEQTNTTPTPDNEEIPNNGDGNEEIPDNGGGNEEIGNQNEIGNEGIGGNNEEGGDNNEEVGGDGEDPGDPNGENEEE